jgi:hypothetical protein
VKKNNRRDTLRKERRKAMRNWRTWLPVKRWKQQRDRNVLFAITSR